MGIRRLISFRNQFVRKYSTIIPFQLDILYKLFQIGSHPQKHFVQLKGVILAFLATDWGHDLVGLYETQTVNYVQDNPERSHYLTTCRYLKRMIKSGGRERIEKIIPDSGKPYPLRKALMEEFDRYNRLIVLCLVV